MRLIGLTGGMGAGKSTVSARLAALGAVVVDADAITRQLQEPGQAVFDAIVARFGPEVVGADGRLDRAALAARVFADPAELAALEAIVHPPVVAEIRRRVDAERAGDAVVVLDIPLLVESGRWPVELLVVVDVPEEVAVARLVASRGISAEEARARMARQAGRARRLAAADRVLDNAGTLEDLHAQVDALWGELAGPAPR